MSNAILVRGGRILDGVRTTPIENGHVLIEDGRIAAIGEGPDPRPDHPPSAVIDATDKSVLPGFVNAHEHIDDRRTFGPFSERVGRPAPMLLIGAVRSSLLSLCEGITTVRDCGGMSGNPLYIRQAVELGVLVGPRVQTCIAPIAQSGGYGLPLSVTADGPDEVRKRVRQLIAQGADFIKCMASMGAAGARARGPTAIQFSLAELSAAFDEAHEAGKRCTVHAHPPEAIQRAIKAGTDVVEHALLMDEASANAMAESGVFLVCTVSEVAVTGSEGRSYRRPRLQVERTQGLLETATASLSTAVKAGVKIAMGLDVLGNPVDEIRMMVAAGMSPVQALQSATRVGAEVMGLETEIGTLEVGKVADIIVIDGNPTEDVASVGRVETVIAGGRVIDTAGLRAAIGDQLPGYVLDHGRLLTAEEYQ